MKIILKLVLLVLMKMQFLPILYNIYYDFLPLNTNGEDVQNQIIKEVNFWRKNCYAYVTFTISGVVTYLIAVYVVDDSLPRLVQLPLLAKDTTPSVICEWWLMIIMLVLLFANAGNDFLIWTIGLNTAMQYVTLGDYYETKMQRIIEEKDNNADTKLLVDELIKEFVDYHNKINSTFSDFHDATKLVYSLQYFSAIPCFCVIVFTLQYLPITLIWMNIPGAIVFIQLIVSNAVLCTAVLERGTDLANSIAYSPWYDLDSMQTRRTLMLILQQCQQPVEYIIGAYIHFGMPALLTILNGIYCVSNLFPLIQQKIM